MLLCLKNNPYQFRYIVNYFGFIAFSHNYIYLVKFNLVLKLIELRNDTLLNKVFPSLSIANIKVGTPLLTEDYIESIICIDNVHKLKT